VRVLESNGLKYLGFIISTDGIQVDPDKVKVIEKLELPAYRKRGPSPSSASVTSTGGSYETIAALPHRSLNLREADYEFSFDDRCIQAFRDAP